jgi:ubiquinone/menaquinone biosynthesis C-methylase UbiE
MNLFAPPRFFDPNFPENLDRPGNDPVSLHEELEALGKINSRWGGHRLILDYVGRMTGAARRKPLNILDLGTGFADIPRAIVEWCRQCRLPVTVTAVDRNPDVLRIAREACRNRPEIKLEQHDLRSLPYAEDSFDLVLCSLALHHLSAEDAVTVLRRIQEIARAGFIVNDLRRNRPAIRMSQWLARTMIKGSMIRHDAVQSARAAFTVRELRAMANRAGLKHFQIRRRQLFFRMVLEGRK